MKTIKKFCALAVCALASLPSLAQQTYQEMEQLTINENVTTVITASEPVRFVDISTDAVVGDQPINNTIRLKPKEGADVHADGDILAIVTIARMSPSACTAAPSLGFRRMVLLIGWSPTTASVEISTKRTGSEAVMTVVTFSLMVSCSIS